MNDNTTLEQLKKRVQELELAQFESKKLETVLQASEEKYRLIAENAAMITVMDMNLRLTYVSPTIMRLRGVTVEEAINQSIDQVLTPESLGNAIAIFEQEMQLEAAGTADPGRTRILELEEYKKDGSTIWVEVSLSFLRDDDRKPVEIVTVSRDITERKRAEEANARLENQLHQAQKMESIGRLAGGVAHDFNNMIGVILVNTEMAMEEVDPAGYAFACIQDIKTAAERSADLTRQLLAFSRKQTIAPKVLDLNETVGSMLKMLPRLIGEDIHLSWLPAKELWPVEMDPSQIDQILANLCVNARDAINGHGNIVIETKNETLDENYCADRPGFLPGEFVLLALSDDGSGMDKETAANIFEPFFTTKEMGKGTGLGLSTVYGIVKQNNGFINVYSETGHGTTFKIYLPSHTAKFAAQKQTGEMEAPTSGNETILLVEDEPLFLDVIKRRLEKLGYTVLDAGTPGEAIRLAREHAEKIHLLMTDVVMPEMNGRDLAKQLTSLYPHIKRLFMSGYTADVIAHHGVLDPGVQFIHKPFSLKDLAAKLRETLDEGK